jgi:hypothetical protein
MAAAAVCPVNSLIGLFLDPPRLLLQPESRQAGWQWPTQAPGLRLSLLLLCSLCIRAVHGGARESGRLLPWSQVKAKALVSDGVFETVSAPCASLKL